MDSPHLEAPGARTPAEALAEGDRIYRANCTACHLADGSGLGGVLAPDLTVAPERLDRDPAELVGMVLDGSTGDVGTMPGWRGQLTEDQVRLAVMWMVSSYGPPPQNR